jgi:NAD(P)-dependent dehydrogenase (short-subunit alcohol dehydrogenase family)
LINNAGAAARKQYKMIKDRVKEHFATNYLGRFLLTNLITDKVANLKEVLISGSSMAYTLAPSRDEGRGCGFKQWEDYICVCIMGRS